MKTEPKGSGEYKIRYRGRGIAHISKPMANGRKPAMGDHSAIK